MLLFNVLVKNYLIIVTGGELKFCLQLQGFCNGIRQKQLMKFSCEVQFSFSCLCANKGFSYILILDGHEKSCNDDDLVLICEVYK